MGDKDEIFGVMHTTGIDSSTNSGTSAGNSITNISASSSIIDSVSGWGTRTVSSSDATLHYYDEAGQIIINPSDEIELEEELSEEVKEKIDKIGTPGKRNIDDLLSSFKVVTDSKKGAPLEELDDKSWMDEIMNMNTKLFTEGTPPPATGAHSPSSSEPLESR